MTKSKSERTRFFVIKTALSNKFLRIVLDLIVLLWCRFNALWGQMFKVGIHDSRFAKQVHYPCIYLASYLSHRVFVRAWATLPQWATFQLHTHYPTLFVINSGAQLRVSVHQQSRESAACITQQVSFAPLCWYWSPSSTESFFIEFSLVYRHFIT